MDAIIVARKTEVTEDEHSHAHIRGLDRASEAVLFSPR